MRNKYYKENWEKMMKNDALVRQFELVKMLVDTNYLEHRRQAGTDDLPLVSLRGKCKFR